MEAQFVLLEEGPLQEIVAVFEGNFGQLDLGGEVVGRRELHPELFGQEGLDERQVEFGGVGEGGGCRVVALLEDEGRWRRREGGVGGGGLGCSVAGGVG